MQTDDCRVVIMGKALERAAYGESAVRKPITNGLHRAMKKRQACSSILDGLPRYRDKI